MNIRHRIPLPMSLTVALYMLYIIQLWAYAAPEDSAFQDSGNNLVITDHEYYYCKKKDHWLLYCYHKSSNQESAGANWLALIDDDYISGSIRYAEESIYFQRRFEDPDRVCLYRFINGESKYVCDLPFFDESDQLPGFRISDLDHIDYAIAHHIVYVAKCWQNGEPGKAQIYSRELDTGEEKTIYETESSGHWIIGGIRVYKNKLFFLESKLDGREVNNQLKCMDLDTGKAIVLADSVYDYTLSEETVCIICQDDSYLMLIDDRGNLISRINVEEFIEEGSLFRVASDEDYLYIAVLGKNSKLLVYDKKMEVLSLNHKSYGITGYGHSLFYWRQTA